MKGVFCGALILVLSAVTGVAVAAGPPQKRPDPAVAKASQEVVQTAAKAGVRSQELRELGAALKQDPSLGQAVLAAIDKGLKGKELAQFIHNLILQRRNGTGANPDAGSPGNGFGGRGRGPHGNCYGMGNGMGQGLGAGMGQGGGQGMGQGMGRGMGHGGGMGRGAGR